ncbi:hypothetical protein D7D25_07725 [Proteiniphilum sp. X52]|nr:hypothetical protein D7D25_07725 [Proteiniphilum sp. X52]
MSEAKSPASIKNLHWRQLALVMIFGETIFVLGSYDYSIVLFRYMEPSMFKIFTKVRYLSRLRASIAN